MQEIHSMPELQTLILKLEQEQAVEGKLLREELHNALESLRPINLIKNVFSQIASSQEIKDNLLNTSVGLTAGYISQKLIVNTSSSLVRKILGTGLIFGITNIVSRNPETVRSLGLGILKIIRTKLAQRRENSGHHKIDVSDSWNTNEYNY